MSDRSDNLKDLSNIFSSLTTKSITRLQVYDFFKNISKTQVKYIIEIIINLLSGNIPIAEIHRRALKQYSPLFRRLALKSVTFSNKRKLIIANIKAILILIKLTQFKLKQLISDNE